MPLKSGLLPCLRSLTLLLILLGRAATLSAQVNASFTVSQNAGCTPLTVQFNNTSTGAVSYSWDFGNGNYSTAVNPSNVYLTPGSFTVKLVAHGPGSSVDSVIVSGIIQTVDPPVAAFTASPRTVCQSGSMVSFQNLSTGYDSCLWDFGDGATSVLNNPAHQYSYAGTFTVTLIAYNTQMGCFTSETKQAYITVLPAPVTSASANITSTCDSSEVFQFSGSAATSWSWNFGDGSVSTIQNPTHVYNQPGLFTITLVTQNAQGCRDTLVLPDYIEVKNSPRPDVFYIGTPDSCAPAAIAIGTNASGVVAYLWDFDDGITSTFFGNLGHFYYNTGTYQPSLTVTYANGCVSSNTAPPINVYNHAPYTFTASGWTGCAPYAVTFTPTNAVGFASWLWDFGDGTTSTQVSPTHVYTAPGNYTVKLTRVAVSGCTSEYVDPNIVRVSAVDAQFTANDLAGCMPHTVNFSYPGSNGLTYSWDFGDGTTSTQMSPSHTYVSNGNYSVSLTVTNTSGCTSTWQMPAQVQVSNGVNNFNPAPVVSACAPFTINLFDNSPATSSWFWDFGDGFTSTAQNPTHTYMTPGTYNVSLTTQSTGSNCSQYVSPYRTYIIKGGIADFDVTQTICPPYTATFTDQSVNAVSWLWDFGDGTTSTLQHPVHVYSAAGNYNVTLTITTSDGCVYEKVHNYAVSFLPLTANVTATTTDTILPMNVQFFANSVGATAWLWDFGDGGSSTLMNPVHTYTGMGPYNITLTISNPGCTFTYVFNGVTVGSGAIIPGGPPDSLHVPDPVFSCIPYEMNFSNPVLNTVAWLWDFGDGDTSTQENPVHIYTDAGSFTVTLITWDASGNTDTIIQPSAINLIGAESDFDFSYLNNCTGSSVVTTNHSTNAVSYLWDFGDGTTSTQFEPTHTYATTGVNYIIALTVTDSGGCTDFMSRSYYAAVTSTIAASNRRVCANDTVFFDSGSLNFASYLWNFGDGSTSTAVNPWHIYADSGSYQVTLTVTDTAGCVNSYQMPYLIKVNKPVANFTYQVIQNGCNPVTLQLTNQSTGSDSWLWDFGNGTTSSQFNPSATYSQLSPGTYNVTLTAYAAGCADSISASGVVIIPQLVADFSFSQSSDCMPVSVTYTDLSIDAVSWQWEFGDGTISTLQHPVHTFNTIPSGPVSLTIYNSLGCAKIKQLPNIQVMMPQFSFADTMGCKPFSVTVTDSSTGVAQWNWNFGDGSTSSLANPQHVYNATGNFNVTLTATSVSGCTQTISPAATITVTGPQAAFTTTSAVSCAPTVVNFTDLSIGAGTWLWDFGDGGQSVLQNPVHIYNQPGTFDVTLAITDSIGCSDTLIMPDLVHITGSIASFSIGSTIGCSPWQVSFQDSSISAFSWLWNFGDGNSSVSQHPVHTYSTPGTYTVSLTTQDTTGCQSIWSSPATITILQPPVAAFSTPDTMGCAPFAVNFTSASQNAASYYWDFGDGTTSVVMSPSHTYTLPGTYTVMLVVNSADGCPDTVVYTDMIKVGLQPQPSFASNVTTGCPPLNVQFMNQSTDTLAGVQYSWTFGNGMVSQESQPFYSYSQPGVYEVTLQAVNPFGCMALVSVPAYIQVLNDAPLPPVQIRSVSVADTGAIDITWANLAVQNLSAYELYRFNPAASAYDLVYTDLNPGNASMNVTSVYRDSLLNTTDTSYTYVVRAVNTCGIATPMASLQSHSSVNVEATEINGDVAVSWNSYGGCPVSGYEILRQDYLSGSFNLIASVSGTTLNYTDTTLYCSMNAAYKIRATSVCGLPFDAFSDTSVVEVPGTLISQPVNVVRSTVVDDEYILTEWAPPVLMPQTVTGYEIYRSDDGGNFNLMDVVPAVQTSYEDRTVNVHTGNFFYRVKVVNICALESAMGVMGSSVWLQTDIDDENISHLRWTHYKDWDTGVDYYVIERMDPMGTWRQIGTVPGTQTNYTDR